MLRNKRGNKKRVVVASGVGGIVIIIVIAIILGIVYVFLGGGYGVGVSCKEMKIIGFQKVPPPLMAAFPPETCRVVYEVQSNGTEVCNGQATINFEKGVAPCSELKNYAGKDLLVEVSFYRIENNESLGSDSKVLPFKK